MIKSQGGKKFNAGTATASIWPSGLTAMAWIEAEPHWIVGPSCRPVLVSCRRIEPPSYPMNNVDASGLKATAPAWRLGPAKVRGRPGESRRYGIGGQSGEGAGCPLAGEIHDAAKASKIIEAPTDTLRLKGCPPCGLSTPDNSFVY